MTIKDILNKYHLSMVQLSKRFGIPYRTIQGWTDEKTANARKCPAYIVKMIDEILEHDSEQ